MANSEITNSNLEAIEFLNLDGLDEVEKIKVLECLRHYDSSVQLPWSKEEAESDSRLPLNNNHDTPQYYQNGYPAPYRSDTTTTPRPRSPPQHETEYLGGAPSYPVLQPVTLYNCYPPNMTNTTLSYVCAPHELCYLLPVQPYQLLPNPGYYEPVSCAYNTTTNTTTAAAATATNSSVYANNAIDHPSAATPNTPAVAAAAETGPPHNNHQRQQEEGQLDVVPVDRHNGLDLKQDEGEYEGEEEEEEQHGPTEDDDGAAAAYGGPRTNGHPVVVTAPPASKSWASLFKGAADSCDTQTHNGSTSDSFKLGAASAKVKSDGDQRCPIRYPKADFDPVSIQLAEYLTDHAVDHKSVSLQPRGLLNRSNYCYINSILQALLACPQMYHLFKGLNKILHNNYGSKKRCTIDKMCQFVKEFETLASTPKTKKSEKNIKKEEPISINCGVPFEPTYVHKMLNGKSDSFQIEGRQEDAEEFLGVLLNALNDEMIEHMNLVRNTTNEIQEKDSDEDKEWHVMGKKNRGSITRKAEFKQTPISTIFGGLLKSRVQRNGGDPTDNIQPFFTLQLNIKKVKTVGEALEALANKIQLEGVMCTKTNKEVEAWQQTTINQLPEVLILHLKCFDYRVNGCTKIIKMVEFPIDLEIENKLLSSTVSIKEKDRQYKLYAVVYHDGKEASKGHYFTDAYHSGYGTWLRYDDAIVKSIQEEQVLKPQGNRVPYLLFYRRVSDRIK